MPTELLSNILSGLMSRYRERVPDVGRVLEIMHSNSLIQNESDIENDHIAFRTLGVPNLGIASLEKVFLHCGYERRDSYQFEKKKLNAFWYAPPLGTFPRVFISELRVGELSAQAQEIITGYTAAIKSDPVDSLNLDDAAAVDNFLHSPLWQLPAWKDFERLQSESEYAAWVIYNRYYLNHFTISVHNLPTPFNTVDRFNQLLEANGIRLNDAGGKIKTSPDGLLIQSSTVAQTVEAEFRSDGDETEKHSIAGSYVEFAERRLLPEYQHLGPAASTRSHRREGFEAGNADKIFESTFTDQIQRDN
ncbi:MAG: DUF1338 domain-containing protein [Aureliella sp.]